MKYGQVGNAFRQSVGYLVNYYYSGLPLLPLLKDVENFAYQCVEYNQGLYFRILAALWQHCKFPVIVKVARQLMFVF
jgi:hypothetical protein